MLNYAHGTRRSLCERSTSSPTYIHACDAYDHARAKGVRVRVRARRNTKALLVLPLTERIKAPDE